VWDNFVLGFSLHDCKNGNIIQLGDHLSDHMLTYDRNENSTTSNACKLH
jgi:hypothetical protein